MMNNIESDKRYGCFIGNQFKESVDVKSSHRKKEKKIYRDKNLKNP